MKYTCAPKPVKTQQKKPKNYCCPHCGRLFTSKTYKPHCPDCDFGKVSRITMAQKRVVSDVIQKNGFDREMVEKIVKAKSFDVMNFA
jgi:predicted class III extradiol MEMO1 family dioxygenase